MINWIAEIGSNHNQDLLRLKRLIIESKKAGFGYIKLQKFNGKTLEYGKDNSNIELSDDLFLKAVQFAKAQDIKIGCSVFDIESLEFVAPHVDFLKISSFDVDRGEFVYEVIRHGLLHNKKVLISWGMSSDNVMKSFIETYVTGKMRIYENTIVHLHCISKYPAKLNECRMDKLHKNNLFYDSLYPYDSCITYDNIGWSDHTVSEIAILTAISKGATWVETHVDIDDMQGSESHHGHVWPMSKIGKLISDYNDCCRYDDEFIGDRMNMADPIDGMRPLKELR